MGEELCGQGEFQGGLVPLLGCLKWGRGRGRGGDGGGETPLLRPGSLRP